MVHPQGVEPRVAAYKTVPQYRRGQGAYWWIIKDSNLEPIGYEPTALTIALMIHIVVDGTGFEPVMYLRARF